MTSHNQDRDAAIRTSARKMGIPDSDPIINKLIQSGKTLDACKVELANHALGKTAPQTPIPLNHKPGPTRDPHNWGRVFARVREEARNA